ncbi:MAG: DUF393 domain-containing protein [Pseudomonadota bacterium]
MSTETTVIFNNTCPICSREIAIYRTRAEDHDLPIGFVGLDEADLGHYGLTADAAARRLYMVRDGQLISGVDAFIVLWRALPGFGWLARLVALPGIRHAGYVVYDYVLAPLLYALHKRRLRRAGLRASR